MTSIWTTVSPFFQQGFADYKINTELENVILKIRISTGLKKSRSIEKSLVSDEIYNITGNVVRVLENKVTMDKSKKSIVIERGKPMDKF